MKPLISCRCGSLSVQEARALVGWSAAILRQLDVQSTKKAVVKLLECQVRVADVFVSESEVAADVVEATGQASGAAAQAPGGTASQPHLLPKHCPADPHKHNQPSGRLAPLCRLLSWRR